MQIAIELTASLRAKGASVWLAAQDLLVGENYAEQIYDQLQESTFFIVMLSRDSMVSAHVRREMNLAIDLRRIVLPIALSPGIVGTTDMPIDWRYWLGIVQVFPHTTVRETADRLMERITPIVSPPKAKGARRGDGEAESIILKRSAVRSSLIDAATGERSFGVVVDRCRKLRCSREQLEALAREFKAAGLVNFSEPLDDETTIRLST